MLLVEDEQIVADIYQLGLGRAGYEVLVANSGRTGPELAETSRPKFIFLDVRMPGMDGVEVLKQLSINPETRHIPVVMLSN